MTLPLSAALKDLEARLGKPVAEEEEIRLYGGVMFGAIPAEGGNNGRTRKMINKIVGALLSLFFCLCGNVPVGCPWHSLECGTVYSFFLFVCWHDGLLISLSLSLVCTPWANASRIPPLTHHHLLYLASSCRMAWQGSKPAPAWPCPQTTLIEWHPLRAWKSYRSCPCPATF